MTGLTTTAGLVAAGAIAASLGQGSGFSATTSLNDSQLQQVHMDLAGAKKITPVYGNVSVFGLGIPVTHGPSEYKPESGYNVVRTTYKSSYKPA